MKGRCRPRNIARRWRRGRPAWPCWPRARTATWKPSPSRRSRRSRPIRRSENADTGDIVVALIDDEEATLKRFRRRGASIALEPANASYEVRILPPNRVRIQGKLVAMFRRY